MKLGFVGCGTITSAMVTGLCSARDAGAIIVSPRNAKVAAGVTRAVPLPSVALRQGPTALYPPSQPIKALFDALGTAIELDDEDEFDAFATATATMASFFSFASTVSVWMTRNGVAPEHARTYVGAMLRGLAETSLATPGRDFAALAGEHQTPGGLNEQVLKLITRDGSFVELDRALDAVLGRLRAGTSATS
jgi:pyrroline-5-carboxylate reductase